MDNGSVICGACRGRQWMRLVWLVCATVPTCVPLVAWGPAKAADLQPIADIRALPTEELAKHPAIHIRGVVTWSDHNFIMQDGSAGIYVNFVFAEQLGLWKGGLPSAEIQPGVEVEIEGSIDPGGFSPPVLPQTVRVLGKKPLPEPRPFNAEQFFSGADDCQRAEVSGVVRSVREGDSVLSLVVEAAGQPFGAEVSRDAVPGDPQRLVDAVVRMTGVATTMFNTRGEWLLPRMFVTDPAGFVVVEPARHAPFDSPHVPLTALGRFRPEPFGGHMIRTEGTVIHSLPTQAVFLQDGAGGVRVDTRTPEKFVPGDRVEVAGFLDRRGRVASLADALVRKIGSGTPLAPADISPDEVVDVNAAAIRASIMARPGDYEGCLIRFPARLLELHATHDGGVLMLGAGGTAVTALVQPADFAALARLRPASELSVTGIVHTDWPAGPGNPVREIPNRMQVLVRTAADVVLVRAPSWWTPQRLAIAAGLLAALAAAATAWAVSLRWEVRRQTAIAVEEEASRRAAALEYEVALRERTRIAADLHDTLLQTMTGIGYQLKFCTSGFDDAVPSEMGEHLGTAERLVSHAARQLRGTVWSLRSMPDVRQPLADAVSALLRLLVEGRGVQVSVETTGESCGVHETVARQLLFVVQEAVLNALHHGAAKTVAVTLAFSPGAAALEMTVRDDGRGFDVGLQPGPGLGHFGIQGMRERVESLDGDFEIASTRGSGTAVTARVPHPERLPADVWAKVGDVEDHERGDA
jgi:signal transduction histidine kinase